MDEELFMDRIPVDSYSDPTTRFRHLISACTHTQPDKGNFMNRSIGLLFGVLATFSGHAVAEMTCDTASCTGVPAAVRADRSGHVLIYPKPNGVDPDTLTCDRYYLSILLENTHAGRDIIYSALLTSLARGESIRIRLDDNEQTCKPLYVVSYE